MKRMCENQTLNLPLPPGFPDSLSSSAATQVVAQGSSRCIFQTAAAKRLSSFNHILLQPCVASVSVAFRFGAVCACVLFKWWCLWNTTNMRPPLIGGHVAANISAGWWDQCFLSWRASVSSLSLVQRLFFFSSWRHNSPTTIPQQSHNNHTTIPPVPLPSRRFFFFSLV